MKTVVILAAGTGKRLGNLTKNFNKAFIRIGDVAAITHIINYFPKDYKFVVVTGYLGDELEQYVKISHPELNCIFVKTDLYEGTGAGPGYAVLKARPFIDGPFFIWTVDTLLKDFKLEEIEHNWIGYCESKNDDGEYSCVELFGNFVSNFYEKQSKKYTNNAYIGCAYIHDYETFWKGMTEKPVVVQEQFQVSAGFYEFLNEKKQVIGKKLDWHDTGNLEKLQETRKQFPARIENLDKDAEEIYFFDNKFVVKYFKDSKMVQNRVERNLTFGDTVPKILRSSKNFYAYEYIKGMDLFSIPNPEDHLLNLLNFMNDNLWKEKKLNPKEFKKFQEICIDFYHNKTKNRLDKLYEKLHLYDKEEKINNVKIPPLNDILESLDWQKLSNGKPTLMHGDFNFSNVLLQPDGKFKLIDWRQDFGGILEYGDRDYDFAKLYSGFLFPHDVIKKNEFRINIGYGHTYFDSFVPSKYQRCEKIFFDFLKENKIDVKKIVQLSAICLLNMSPLHQFPLNVYLFYCGKYLLWESSRE